MEIESRNIDEFWVTCKPDEPTQKILQTFRDHLFRRNGKESYFFEDCPRVAEACEAKQMSADGSPVSIWIRRGKKSGLPFVNKGRVETAKVRILCHDQNNNVHMIYVHDKEHRCATPIGGQAHEAEYDIKEDFERAYSIIERMITLQSFGFLNDGSFLARLFVSCIHPLARLQFSSNDHGLSLSHVGWQTWTLCTHEPFLAKLFSSVPNADGVHLLRYASNHPQTNWIAAVPIDLILQKLRRNEALKLDGIEIEYMQMILDSLAYLRYCGHATEAQCENHLANLNALPATRLPSSFVFAKLWHGESIIEEQSLKPPKRCKSTNRTQSLKTRVGNEFILTAALGIAAVILWKKFPSFRLPFATFGLASIGVMVLFQEEQPQIGPCGLVANLAKSRKVTTTSAITVGGSAILMWALLSKFPSLRAPFLCIGKLIGMLQF